MTEYKEVPNATWDDVRDGDRVTSVAERNAIPRDVIIKLERPVPEVQLPTEPGHYIDNTGSAWTFREPDIDRIDGYRTYAPFTRLYTEAEVANRIAEFLEYTGQTSSAGRIRSEFGGATK